MKATSTTTIAATNTDSFTYRASLVLIILLMCLPTVAISAAEEPQTGVIEFMAIEGNERPIIQGLHIESYVDIQASGLIAVVNLTQTFKNPSNQWVEGRYLFPLPDDAAVNGMEMHIGDRLIKGVIKEKQAAKKIYQQAKSAGKKASLMEQHRPNLFSQKVANIGPQEHIVVKLRYQQPISYKNEAFHLRFPMTITPRYIPGAQHQNQHPSSEANSHHQAVEVGDQGWGWANATTQVPDAHLITPPMVENTSTEAHMANPISINILLDAGLPLASIDSHYHDISTTKKGHQHLIELAKGKVTMDRDFSLSWKTTASATPTAAVFNETINGDDYSLIMLMPPILKQANNTANTIPKDSIFIIDTSGSMGGTSIRQAKKGLIFALQQLTQKDTFNIIEFNSQYSLFQQQPVQATKNNIQQAIHFVEKLNAGGGTEMLSALNAAFSQKQTEHHLKQIIFITDGSIGNEENLFSSIHKNLGSARLFTIGIGSAPNSFFMRKAAEFGRGSFTYIGDINEVNQKMADFFSQITQPNMRDISAHTKTEALTQLQNIDIFPKRIPDLYQGEPIMIAVRKDYEMDNLIIKGNYQGKPWQQLLSIKNGKNHAGISTIWARKKIESLLDDKRTGTAEDTIKPKVLNIALTHQLMSPYTSFVAVEEKISRQNNQAINTLPIPNIVAKGQTLQHINYPQTATPLWLHLFSGFISIFLALLLQRRYCKQGL